MDWFDESQRVGWLVIFWIASFALLMAAFWLMSRRGKRRLPRVRRYVPRPSA